MTRKKLISVAALAVLALACSEPTTMGSGGSGGAGGTGGAPPPPDSVDKTCRDVCDNEPDGFSCFNGPPELVEGCYEQCLSDFQSYGSCGDEWIAIYDCYLALECDDLFGDCDSALEPLNECVRLANNRLYCEASCPQLDIVQCEQDTTECSAADNYCAEYCRMQDRKECIEQYLSTGACDAGGTGGTGGTGGAGGTVEPGPTCIAFCMRAYGECEAYSGDETGCRYGCQLNLDFEYATDERCGTAAEDAFHCAAELSCQDLYDWRDQTPPDAFPCRDEVLIYDALVGDGTCLAD